MPVGLRSVGAIASRSKGGLKDVGSVLLLAHRIQPFARQKCLRYQRTSCFVAQVLARALRQLRLRLKLCVFLRI
ncbi:MAG: hypothetical protein QNJ36_01280 [Calothrix sp. MO_167.B42]|nr:hypothetical protein [Calothrix sp. MO_167.B42]